MRRQNFLYYKHATLAVLFCGVSETVVIYTIIFVIPNDISIFLWLAGGGVDAVADMGGKAAAKMGGMMAKNLGGFGAKAFGSFF